MKNTVFSNRKWDLTEKIELAKKISELNPHCMISGSVALWLQNIDLRRSPVDIDVYIPPSVQTMPHILAPEGYVEQQADDYGYFGDEQDFERRTFVKPGGKDKIDFLVQIRAERPKPESYFCHKTNLRLVLAETIISFKIQHALDCESHARWKHKDDVIHMMVNS